MIFVFEIWIVRVTIPAKLTFQLIGRPTIAQVKKKSYFYHIPVYKRMSYFQQSIDYNYTE